MIARAPIVDSKSNLKMTQETQDRDYLSYQLDKFKIDNALVYQIPSKLFTDMDVYVYVKQRNGTQDGQAVFFDDHKHFLDPDYVARQATEAEIKLQNMVRERLGIVTIMLPSTKNSTPLWKWLQLHGQ